MTHKCFVTESRRIVKTARDWNAEFQALWETVPTTAAAAASRDGRLEALLLQFKDEAFAAVRDLSLQWVADDGAPPGLPEGLVEVEGFPHCFRAGNVLFRAWSNDRMARYIQRATQAVLHANSPGLCVPVAATLRYRGTLFTAQALVPLGPTPRVAYRGDGQRDAAPDHIAHAAVRRVLDSLNITVDTVEGQQKLGRVEVVEGLDGRLYCTDLQGLLPLLFPGSPNGPYRRLESLTVVDAPAAFAADRTHTTETGTVLLFRALPPLLALPDHRRQVEVVAALHRCGLNVALLGLLANVVVDEDAMTAENRGAALATFSVEMLCRAAKSLFYAEISAMAMKGHVVGVDKCVSRALAMLLDEDDAAFEQKLFQVVCRKFDVKPEKDSPALAALIAARHSRRQLLVQRFCDLVGVELPPDSAAPCGWRPLHHGSILPPRPEETGEEALRGIAAPSRLFVVGVPPLAALQLRRGKAQEAAQSASLVVADRKMRFGRDSVHYAWAVMDHAVCLVCADRVDGGVAQATEALTTVMRLAGGPHAAGAAARLLVAKQLLTIGGVLMAKNRHDVATAFFRRALEGFQTIDTGVEHFAVPLLRGLEGLLAAVTSQEGPEGQQLSIPSVAVASTLRLAALDEVTAGGEGAAALYAFMMDLTNALLHRAVFNTALQLLRHATVICEALYGPSADLATTLSATAFALFHAEGPPSVPRCRELMSRALEVTAAAFGADSLECAVMRSNAGSFLLQAGLEAQAYDELRAAEAIFVRRGATQNPNYAVCKANLERFREARAAGAATKIEAAFRGFTQRRGLGRCVLHVKVLAARWMQGAEPRRLKCTVECRGQVFRLPLSESATDPEWTCGPRQLEALGVEDAVTFGVFSEEGDVNTGLPLAAASLGVHDLQWGEWSEAWLPLRRGGIDALHIALRPINFGISAPARARSAQSLGLVSPSAEDAQRAAEQEVPPPPAVPAAFPADLDGRPPSSGQGWFPVPDRLRDLCRFDSVTEVRSMFRGSGTSGTTDAGEIHLVAPEVGSFGHPAESRLCSARGDTPLSFRVPSQVQRHAAQESSPPEASPDAPPEAPPDPAASKPLPTEVTPPSPDTPNASGPKHESDGTDDATQLPNAERPGGGLGVDEGRDGPDHTGSFPEESAPEEPPVAPDTASLTAPCLVDHQPGHDAQGGIGVTDTRTSSTATAAPATPEAPPMLPVAPGRWKLQVAVVEAAGLPPSASGALCTVDAAGRRTTTAALVGQAPVWDESFAFVFSPGRDAAPVVRLWVPTESGRPFGGTAVAVVPLPLELDATGDRWFPLPLPGRAALHLRFALDRDALSGSLRTTPGTGVMTYHPPDPTPDPTTTTTPEPSPPEMGSLPRPVSAPMPEVPVAVSGPGTLRFRMLESSGLPCEGCDVFGVVAVAEERCQSATRCVTQGAVSWRGEAFDVDIDSAHDDAVTAELWRTETERRQRSVLMGKATLNVAALFEAGTPMSRVPGLPPDSVTVERELHIEGVRFLLALSWLPPAAPMPPSMGLLQLRVVKVRGVPSTANVVCWVTVLDGDAAGAAQQVIPGRDDAHGMAVLDVADAVRQRVAVSVGSKTFPSGPDVFGTAVLSVARLPRCRWVDGWASTGVNGVQVNLAMCAVDFGATSGDDLGFELVAMEGCCSPTTERTDSRPFTSPLSDAEPSRAPSAKGSSRDATTKDSAKEPSRPNSGGVIDLQHNRVSRAADGTVVSRNVVGTPAGPVVPTAPSGGAITHRAQLLEKATVDTSAISVPLSDAVAVHVSPPSTAETGSRRPQSSSSTRDRASSSVSSPRRPPSSPSSRRVFFADEEPPPSPGAVRPCSLEVMVEAARGLVGPGLLDPVVLIHCGAAKARTATLEGGGPDPSWGPEPGVHPFPVVVSRGECDPPVLRVSVLHEGTAADIPLGAATVTLTSSTVPRGAWGRQWLPLDTHGEVLVAIRGVDFGHVVDDPLPVSPATTPRASEAAADIPDNAPSPGLHTELSDLVPALRQGGIPPCDSSPPGSWEAAGSGSESGLRLGVRPYEARRIPMSLEQTTVALVVTVGAVEAGTAAAQGPRPRWLEFLHFRSVTTADTVVFEAYATGRTEPFGRGQLSLSEVEVGVMEKQWVPLQGPHRSPAGEVRVGLLLEQQGGATPDHAAAFRPSIDAAVPVEAAPKGSPLSQSRDAISVDGAPPLGSLARIPEGSGTTQPPHSFTTRPHKMPAPETMPARESRSHLSDGPLVVSIGGWTVGRPSTEENITRGGGDPGTSSSSPPATATVATPGSSLRQRSVGTPRNLGVHGLDHFSRTMGTPDADMHRVSLPFALHAPPGFELPSDLFMGITGIETGRREAIDDERHYDVEILRKTEAAAREQAALLEEHHALHRRTRLHEAKSRQGIANDIRRHRAAILRRGGAALVVQRAGRGYLLRRPVGVAFNTVAMCAAVVQAFLRARSSTVVRRRRAAHNETAALLGRVFHGYVTRIKMAALFRHKLRVVRRRVFMTAMRLQRVGRGFVVRRALADSESVGLHLRRLVHGIAFLQTTLRARSAALCCADRGLTIAAAVLQRCGRGAAERRAVGESCGRAARVRQIAAASTVTAALRARQSEALVVTAAATAQQCRDDAVAVLHGAAAGLQARRAVALARHTEHRTRCAVRVQATMRAHQSEEEVVLRELYRQLNRAVVFLSSAMAGLAARRALGAKRLSRAAVLLQRCGRAVAARRALDGAQRSQRKALVVLAPVMAAFTERRRLGVRRSVLAAAARAEARAEQRRAEQREAALTDQRQSVATVERALRQGVVAEEARSRKGLAAEQAAITQRAEGEVLRLRSFETKVAVRIAQRGEVGAAEERARELITTAQGAMWDAFAHAARSAKSALSPPPTAHSSPRSRRHPTPLLAPDSPLVLAPHPPHSRPATSQQRPPRAPSQRPGTVPTQTVAVVAAAEDVGAERASPVSVEDAAPAAPAPDPTIPCLPCDTAPCIPRDDASADDTLAALLQHEAGLRALRAQLRERREGLLEQLAISDAVVIPAPPHGPRSVSLPQVPRLTLGELRPRPAALSSRSAPMFPAPRAVAVSSRPKGSRSRERDGLLPQISAATAPRRAPRTRSSAPRL